MTPPVMFHAAAGVIGMLSGVTALSAAKGGPLHRRAGTVFFLSMILLGASGAWLGYAKGEVGNIVAGVLTIYFLATAWMAAKRGDGETGWFEIGACVFAAAGGAIAFFFAYVSVRDGSALLGGIPAYGFATVVALCGLLDLSAILRGGVSGQARIARHLWRMHLGLFIAVGSFFPGQLQLFPDYIRQIRPIILLFTPPFLVLGLMIYWLVHIRIDGRFRTRRTTAPALPAEG
ncbi:MAG: DUF2306 domain-containing protein [Caulobacter sp.]|nr:DUF2306 domain-containing protein [Caulobacter sp.]